MRTVNIKKRLGEIVLRTQQYHKMIDFYENVVGLEKYTTYGYVNFYKISDDFEGHPQLLAIFKEDHQGPGKPNFKGFDIQKSSLHHFAFAMEKEEFQKQKYALETLGYDCKYTEFSPLKWQSIFIFDPDGNTVEFVSHNKNLK
ncbi:VOC family protein [Tenacibaculum singaporense]|uniref:VOC family protein n=1 Tax=Tenacibaculum singaporense TaxID=2358479 RepID=UPI000F66869B|nr:VOC family protein [Tenacibaculum singaporense]RSC92799.1 hypothetical protein EI424_13530 [Tenacibaculum singaporense]